MAYKLVITAPGQGQIKEDDNILYTWFMVPSEEGWYYRIFEGAERMGSKIRKITPRYPQQSYYDLLNYVRAWLKEDISLKQS